MTMAPNEDPSHDDRAWIDRARTLLDRSADALDAASLSRLNRARQAALVQRRARRTWIVGLGLAAAAALVLAIGFATQRIETERTGAPARADAALEPADIDVLIEDDDALELYENLDFYAWLDEQDGDSNG